MPRRAAEGIELLADPTRRQIIALIADRVWHPADIADALKLSRPAISRQLLLLMDGGLIRRRRSALDLRSRAYFIDPSMQPAIIAWLAGVDLRNVRPIFRPDWSPPPRVHRQRRDVQAWALSTVVSVGRNHHGFGRGGGGARGCACRVSRAVRAIRAIRAMGATWAIRVAWAIRVTSREARRGSPSSRPAGHDRRGPRLLPSMASLRRVTPSVVALALLAACGSSGPASTAIPDSSRGPAITTARSASMASLDVVG